MGWLGSEVCSVDRSPDLRAAGLARRHVRGLAGSRIDRIDCRIALNRRENAEIAIARSSFGQIERIIKILIWVAVFAKFSLDVWADMDDSG